MSRVLKMLDLEIDIITNLKQKAYWKWKKDNAKVVAVTEVAEVSPNLVEYIKSECRPKECYTNALRLCPLFGDSKWVIGKAIGSHGIDIFHAWIKAGDLYLDPTWELISGGLGIEYVSMLELEIEEVLEFQDYANGIDDSILGWKYHKECKEKGIAL